MPKEGKGIPGRENAYAEPRCAAEMDVFEETLGKQQEESQSIHGGRTTRGETAACRRAR